MLKYKVLAASALTVGLLVAFPVSARPVIVEFTTVDGTVLVAQGDAFSTPHSWNKEASDKRVAWRASAIATARSDLLASLPGHLVAAVTGDYVNFPFVTADLDEDEIAEVLGHPQVVAVHEDQLRYALTASANAYIGSEEWFVAGYTGEGTSVAILDTGIRYWNGHFGTCDEAGDEGCRVKAFEGFATAPHGPGETDPYAVANQEPHGTNVGGIVGDLAPGTDLLSLGVFTVYPPDSSSGWGGGSLTSDSECVAALDWCITNRDVYNIVAANLSLGSGPDESDSGYCTGWRAGSYMGAFNNCRDAGIMPMVAAGNDYVKTAIGSPACCASAATISAGYDDPAFGYECGTGPVIPGSVVCFSNSNSLTDLVAPGNDLDAGGLYGYSGTSMATPAAAAVYAVYQSRWETDPFWTLERIRADAAVVQEQGPRQLYLHRYVRMGDHDAELTWDTGVMVASSFDGLDIPDGDAVTGISVSGDAVCEVEQCVSDTAGNVYLDVTIDHARTGDLVIEVESPDGSVARHEFEDDDVGLENMNSILGSQHLEGALDALSGASIVGTWTVRVWDDTAGTSGRLHKAALLVDSARVQLEAVIEAPAIGRPDEPFDVNIHMRNSGNLAITGAPITLEMVDRESGEIFDSVDLAPGLPMAADAEEVETLVLEGPQGAYTLRLVTPGLEPDLLPGLVTAPVDLDITYRTFASFDVTPTFPEPNVEADVVPLSRGIITSWEWDFGDGAVSSDPDPAHTWTEVGDYVVTLTVEGPDGRSSTSRIVPVRTPPPPGYTAGGGSCGCSVPGAGPGGAAGLAVLVLLAALGLAFARGRGRWTLALALAFALGTAACHDSKKSESDADAEADGADWDPWLSLLDPADPSEGDIDVWVMLSSTDSQTCDVVVEYTHPGVDGWLPATLEDPDESLELASSPEGLEYGITWQSAVDVPDDVMDVRIRATATCDDEETVPMESLTFTLLNFLVAHPHAVLVTEVSSANDNVPADINSNYVELTNTTDQDIDLEGWTLIVTSPGGTELDIPLDGLVIPASSRLSLTHEGADVPGGTPVTDTLPWSVSGGGAVALIATRDRGIDFVRWGGSAAAPPLDLEWTDDPVLPIPQTLTVLNREDETTDTDRASDFCIASPTPGQETDGCITQLEPSDVLVSEVATQGMYDQVEVYNATDERVDMGGWVLLWDGDDLGAGQIPLGAFGIEPGERLVLRDNGTAGRILYGGIMELGENLNIDGLLPTAIGLQDPYGTVVDFLAGNGSNVRWTDWHGEDPTPMPGPDTTLSRLPGDPDTDSAADFCLTSDNLGSPTPLCLEPIETTLVITEVSVGRPDWVEIWNYGTTTQDLSDVYVSYTAPFYGGSVGDYRLAGTLAPGEFQVISERSLDEITGELTTGGENIALASDGAGTVALRDVWGYGIDFVTWGEEAAGAPIWPDTWIGLGYDVWDSDLDFFSIQRYPHDAADTDTRDDWCWAMPSVRAPNNPCE